MYRDPTRIRKTPQDTKFWQHAANLKRDKYKTIVHALAWKYPKVYRYLIDELKNNIPLERIRILLWRDYYHPMKALEDKGYGSFSPSSLKTFRDKYFRTGNLPKPDHIRRKKLIEIEVLMIQGRLARQMAASLADIEKRVWVTKTGQKFRAEAFDFMSKAAAIEIQLHHSSIASD